MLLVFVVLPLVMLLFIDGSAVSWWVRRSALMNNGVPVTGEVMHINVSVTTHVNQQTLMSTSSTTTRPVVRFTPQTGEPITTSPMRSGLDKFLIPGEPVKIRYSAANPMRCVVDQAHGTYQDVAGLLAVLVISNIFLIGFAITAWHM